MHMYCILGKVQSELPKYRLTSFCLKFNSLLFYSAFSCNQLHFQTLSDAIIKLSLSQALKKNLKGHRTYAQWTLDSMIN